MSTSPPTGNVPCGSGVVGEFTPSSALLRARGPASARLSLAPISSKGFEARSITRPVMYLSEDIGSRKEVRHLWPEDLWRRSWCLESSSTEYSIWTTMQQVDLPVLRGARGRPRSLPLPGVAGASPLPRQRHHSHRARVRTSGTACHYQAHKAHSHT